MAVELEREQGWQREQQRKQQREQQREQHHFRYIGGGLGLVDSAKEEKKVRVVAERSVLYSFETGAILRPMPL